MIKLWLDVLNPNLVSLLNLVIVDPCGTAFEKKIFFAVFGQNGNFWQKTGYFNFYIDPPTDDIASNLRGAL